jgi:hypothetical protein
MGSPPTSNHPVISTTMMKGPSEQQKKQPPVKKDESLEYIEFINNAKNKLVSKAKDIR